jgi:hypothetical protein
MVRFYKMLTANLCHNGFTYKDGLNVDTLPFQPKGECMPGGLYYTTFEYLSIWYMSCWPLIADVTVPDGARVYTEPCNTKWKADRIVLSNIRPLSEFLATLDEEVLRGFLFHNPRMLKHVSNQTEALCLVAVRANGHVLSDVHKQTDTICLAAVQQTAYALEQVEEQNDDICMTAVCRSGYTLEAVRNQTNPICMAAVQENANALQFVRDQTDQICLEAVRKNGQTLKYVRNQTDAICLAAVEQDGWALKHVRNQTEAICRAAIADHSSARLYVNIPITFYPCDGSVL